MLFVFNVSSSTAGGSPTRRPEFPVILPNCYILRIYRGQSSTFIFEWVTTRLNTPYSALPVGPLRHALFAGLACNSPSSASWLGDARGVDLSLAIFAFGSWASAHLMALSLRASSDGFRRQPRVFAVLRLRLPGLHITRRPSPFGRLWFRRPQHQRPCNFFASSGWSPSATAEGDIPDNYSAAKDLFYPTMQV